MSIPIVSILTKRGCTLCERSYFIVRRLKYKFPIDVKIIDINKQRAYLKYSSDLPVIMVNEEVVSKLKINERSIRLAIEKALCTESILDENPKD